MKKARPIIDIVVNVLLLGAVGVAISNIFLGYIPETVTMTIQDLMYNFGFYMAGIVGLFALLAIVGDALILAGKKPCPVFPALKLIGLIAALICAGMAAIYFCAIKNMPWDYLYDYHFNLYVHIVIPALALISFFVGNKPRLRWFVCFLGIIPAAAYGGAMGALVNLEIIADPYGANGFFLFDKELIYPSVIWIAGFAVGSIVLALILLLLRNIGVKDEVPAAEVAAPAEDVHPVASVEPAPEAEQPAPEQPKVNLEKAEPEAPAAEPVAEPAPAPEPEPAPEEKPVVKAAETGPKENEKPAAKPVSVESRPVAPTRKVNPYNGKARAYHITKQPSGKWQVKLAGGQRAIRVFNTQLEAIAFTKGLVESQGGSYRIHSVSGKIRK